MPNVPEGVLAIWHSIWHWWQHPSSLLGSKRNSRIFLWLAKYYLSPSHTWALWKQELTSSLHLGWHQWLACLLRNWCMASHFSSWYYHQSTYSLWEVLDQQWRHHGSLPQRTCQLKFHAIGMVEEPPLPGELDKAKISQQGQTIWLMGSRRCSQPVQGIDLCQALRMAVFSIQWQLEIQLVGSQQQMQEALLSQQVFMVSNSLFKDEAGMAAWIIEGSTSSTRLVGQWHTLGQSLDHSSFCSKLVGIVGTLYTLTFWHPNTTQPTLRLACKCLLVIT